MPKRAQSTGGERDKRKARRSSQEKKNEWYKWIKTPCMKLTERQMPIMWWWSASIQEQLLSLAWPFDTCVSFLLWKLVGVFVCSSFFFINICCWCYFFFFYWFVSLDEVNDCVSLTLCICNMNVFEWCNFCEVHSFLPSDGWIVWNRKGQQVFYFILIKYGIQLQLIENMKRMPDDRVIFFFIVCLLIWR